MYRIPAQPAMFTVFIKHRENHLCDMTFNVIHQVPFTDMCDLATFQLCKLSGASRSRLALSACLTAAGCQKMNQIIKSGCANARMKPFKCATPNRSRYGSVLVCNTATPKLYLDTSCTEQDFMSEIRQGHSLLNMCTAF